MANDHDKFTCGCSDCDAAYRSYYAARDIAPNPPKRKPKMSSKEKAQKLYEGKRFYVLNPDGTVDGPREDIYYCVPTTKVGNKKYKYVQVIGGQPKQAFTKEEILVLKNGKQVV